MHPDTLPTLAQTWRLPASLAPSVQNAFSPRLVQGGGLLYVYDHHGRRLAAVKPQTGKVVWHAPVPSRSDRAFSVTPLHYNDRVFVGSDGFLYSFDAKSGQLKWRLATKGAAVSGIAHSKHHLVLPWVSLKGAQAEPGVHLWAVDARRGQVEWSKKFPGSLAYVRGNTEGVYYVSDTGVVLGLTADRGEPKWQLRVKGKVSQPPQLQRDRLYILSSLKKAGWRGTGLTAVDVSKGKLLWQTTLSAPRVALFFDGDTPLVAGSDGQLVQLDAAGKPVKSIDLGFGEEPLSIQGSAEGGRAYVFSYHPDRNGYIRLVDLTKGRVLATANALDMGARAMIPAAKVLVLDGDSGDLYAYRMDRSQRPKRASVPPEEFAQEMIERAGAAKAPLKRLSHRLAGLGPKALPAIETALLADNPYVAEAAARAVGYLGNRRSVLGLLKALTARQGAPAADNGGRADPAVALIEALADLRDGRAVGALQKLLESTTQSHERRRAAYIALGAIGTPPALAPLWTFRGIKQVPSTRWNPQAFTPSFSYQVEKDVEGDAASWPDEVRKQTAITVKGPEDTIYTAALSPYLGGYNDIWLGRSDLSGVITEPYFSGLTKPEVAPRRFIRFKKLSVSDKGRADLVIETLVGQRWMQAQPIKLSLRSLAQDSDRDGLPDMVEERLHTCVNSADCDGDGLKDGEDLNPLASGKLRPTLEQQLFREAFFTFYAFLERRGIVVVDPGDGPSFELYGRKDPILSLRRPTIEKLRKQVGLHALDFVSFGGPYPEGSGSGDAKPTIVFNKNKTEATLGLDIFRSAENAVAYNVSLKKIGRNWVVTRFFRVWTTN